MFYEYALDPASLCNRQSLRYFLDAFGPWKGRFLAKYPKSWKRMVFDALVASDIGEVEKLSCVERLEKADSRIFSARPGARFDKSRSWIDNTLVEHDREPFQAVLTNGARAEAFVLNAAEVDERSLLWAVHSGALVPRTPIGLTRALGLMLRVSTHVVLIDPYFRADQPDKRSPLAALCQSIDCSAKVEVHWSDEAESMVSYAFGMRKAETDLPGVLPAGVVVTMHCWKQRPGGERIHNRYLLTDVGGVQFGDGIERGGRGEHDRLSILDEPSREKLWRQYVDPRNAFDASGAPRTVVGSRKD